MRKINAMVAVVAVTVAMATTSVTAYASEGIDVVVSGRTFDEAPVVEEPAQEEPTQEPTPAEEPAVEPAVEPTPVVEPTVEPTQDPTPAPQPETKEEVVPSNNDDNNESDNDNTSSNDEQPVVDNTPASTPVEQTVVTPATVVEETPVVATATTVATKATVAKAAAPKAVLGVDRVVSVPEDQDIEEVEEVVVEEENDEAGASILALLFALLVALGALIFFLLGRKYQVIKKTVDEDGEVSEEILKKFFSIEKACEYVRDFEWDAEDRDYDSLRIENKSYDEEYEDENGNTQYNGQYVYVVSEDHAQEAIINASDNEVDAIGRILGFVQEEVLA